MYLVEILNEMHQLLLTQLSSVYKTERSIVEGLFIIFIYSLVTKLKSNR